MLNSIEQAVKPHDRYQIEFKLDYELRDSEKTKYQVSTYIFVPKNLGVHPQDYTQKDFYRDIQNYIRLKTPPLILREFTEHSASPLYMLKRSLKMEDWAIKPELQQRVIQQLKLLSAMLKSAIREHLNLINRRIDESVSVKKAHLSIYNLIEEFLVECQKITTEYRKFFTTFNLPNVDAKIFSAYQFTDESISLLIEESTIELFQIATAYLKKNQRLSFQQAMENLVKSETHYRKERGYTSILRPDNDNEEYIYRLSVLKKYASSVLFLSTNTQREGVALEQILYAIAAGLSMIFATIIGFYFQNKYGNFTFPFFIALVVGYMFKDRIKESGRAFFSKLFLDRLPDRKTIIRTQDGKHTLGILREKMRFVSEAEISPSVMHLRNRDSITDLDNDGRGEYVIRYTKSIELYRGVFKDIWGEGSPAITGLNDIMRYDIRPYLRTMAEPVQMKNYLSENTVQEIPCHKVYHLTFISRYTARIPQSEKMYRRIRLILNQKGIKRVENIPN